MNELLGLHLSVCELFSNRDRAVSVVFVSHPFSSDPPRNQSLVAQIARSLVMQGHVPLCPQIYLPAFIDEDAERDVAVKICLRLLALADEVWVYGGSTVGMKLEIAEARRLGIPVVQKKRL